MKTIKYINTVVVGIPLLLLLLYPILKESSFIYAALFAIITGIVQIALALKLASLNTNDLYIKIYFAFVLFFFALWIVNVAVDYNKIITYTLFPIPVVLSIYLSVIIYKKQNN